MQTSSLYSPWDLLPVPEPRTESPTLDSFYNTTAKHLIKDTVRIMQNGLPIDLDKVEELEGTLDTVLTQVRDTLDQNPLIQTYQSKRYEKLLADYRKDRKSKMKAPSDFLKDFKQGDMTHRSYVANSYAKDKRVPAPPDTLPTGCPKWTVKDLRKHIDSHPILKQLVEKTINPLNGYVTSGMQDLAHDKAELYNRKYKDDITNAKDRVDLPSFNPASSTQKQELFEFLNLKSEATSKTTGLPSWDRDQIERLNKETADEHIRELTQSMIDFSFGAIIKNNFIKAFYDYTLDGRLYGQYNLFGAKSFRYTSKAPNMLNLPSTRSIYAKPVKKCFVAPEGYVVYAIDYSALEDRVIASLTRDPNKCAVFTDGLDGHCLNALGYFKEEIAEHMTLTGDTKTDTLQFFHLQEHGHKELEDIRQKGKGVTFGLSYGAFPPKVAATLKISIPAAQVIFDRYHNELYSGITDYRENYVLPTAETNGKIHLGMGCYISTDNANRDIRTLNNATCQFWSILTALSINKIHQAIDQAQLQDEIQCISTIYDSIYFIVRKDADTIKWLNDRIVTYMMKDFMLGQEIKNEACGEIGYNWADLELVPNGASIEEINEVLEGLDDES